MQTPIWEVRPDTGQPLVDAVMRDERVTSVTVASPLIPEFLVAAVPERERGEIVSREAPVIRNGAEVGTIRVEMSTAPLDAELSRLWGQVLIIGSLQLLLGLLLVVPLLRLKVIGPMNRLVGQSKALAAGKLDRPFSWRRADELGFLGRSFEKTRQSLANLFGDLEQRNLDLKNREAELATQAALLRAALDNMTDGICFFDDRLRVRVCNQRFAEILNFQPEMVTPGTALEDMIRFDIDRGEFTTQNPDALVDEMLSPYRVAEASETQLRRGRSQILQVRRRPVPGGGFVTTYSDVTEQLRARREADETLHLLEAVMDAVPAILHVKSRDLRYQFVNRYFLDLFGLRRDQVLGHKLAEVMRPEWLTEFEDRGPEVIATGKGLPFYELAIRRADGRRLEMLGSKVPLLDANGDVSHVVTFEIDITDRKRMQQALSDSEELYRLLVDLSPYGIILHDAAGILFMNPAGCRTLGASGPETVVGRNYLDFIAPSDRQEGQERLRRILDHGESLEQTERQLVTIDNREIIVGTTGVPFSRGDQRLALILFVDITEMKRAEEEIGRQRDALHQAEKITAFGSLLAGVAHELNNPLSVVVGRATMLGEMDLEPSVATGIAKISAAADRCSSIVKTFLAMARQQPPTRVYVDVNALIESSLDLLGYGFSSSGIRIVKNLAADLPGTMADPEQLTQVISNLLINAKQAMDGWTGRRELTIHTAFDPPNQPARNTRRRQRPGNRRRSDRARVRPVFHHQGRRRRHRDRAGGLPRDHRRPRRIDHRRECRCRWRRAHRNAAGHQRSERIRSPRTCARRDGGAGRPHQSPDRG